MIYSPLTYKAMRICYEAHKDVWDKSGAPYVFHPFTVAERMNDEISTAVALLHDVVEDTDWTFDDLRNEGIPESVIEPLKLVTHAPEIPYMQYIFNLSKDPVARKVKLSDLAHNMDESRYCREMTDQEKRKQVLYQKAKEYLLSCQ